MHSQELELAVQQVNNGQAILVDVRRPEEWEAGHSAQAIHFDSDRLLQHGELPDINKDSQIYLYCVSGGRAGRVKTALLNFGFKHVGNVGGLRDWLAAGGK